MVTLSSTKEAKIYNGKKTASLTSGVGKTGQQLVKEWNSTLSNTIHKNKLKMDYRSKCKTRNYKTPRGEYRQNTLWHKSQQDPLWTTSQNTGNKSKSKKWNLMKLKSFCTTKETISKEKIIVNKATVKDQSQKYTSNSCSSTPEK